MGCKTSSWESSLEVIRDARVRGYGSLSEAVELERYGFTSPSQSESKDCIHVHVTGSPWCTVEKNCIGEIAI